MRSLLYILVCMGVALLAGFFVPQVPPSRLILGLLALVIFILSFINIEWGLYILIFSMLLSPEFMAGQTDGGALGRGITLRLEDFLLVVIGSSWFARTAVKKELGLFLKTPLNKAILFYALACVVSTGFGMMAGRVEFKSGILYVLKYLEYFIVFFMVVNHLRDTEQIKRFVFCLLLTCFIVALIGAWQIPGGGRVSAPFEGEVGEPNTFGGYLLLVGMVVAGLLSRTQSLRTRQVLGVLLVCMLPPFLFTQSRSSYLAIVPALMVLGLMMDRRLIILGVLIIGFMLSPLFLPQAVKNRIMYTFTQPESQGQVKIGDIRLDTSTSARLISWKQTLQDWPQHPLFGYGVTGYPFVDAQFPRVLIETGILGLIAFFYLLFSIFRVAVNNLKAVKEPYLQGLGVGFLAGFVGLVVHAIGANTFIIVRIMEPFWFFAGIIVVMPVLEGQPVEQPQKFKALKKAVAPGM